MVREIYKGNLSFRDKVMSLDFTLIFLILILGAISFFAMYSSEQGKIGYYTLSHIYRFSIFFMVFLIVSFFSTQFWYKSSYLFYFIVLVLLFAVDFFGVVASGSKRWISLYFLNLQPSELMKIALIIFFSQILL